MLNLQVPGPGPDRIQDHCGITAFLEGHGKAEHHHGKTNRQGRENGTPFIAPHVSPSYPEQIYHGRGAAAIVSDSAM